MSGTTHQRHAASMPAAEPQRRIRGFLIERLDTACHRAARGAADALAAFLGCRIGLASSPPVQVDLCDLPGLISASDARPFTVVAARLSGEVEGTALLGMTRASEQALIRLLSRQVGWEPSTAWNDARRSMLSETANIVLSAFINHLAASTQRRISVGVPHASLDLAGPSIISALVASGATADRCLAVACRFRCIGERIAGHILILPSESTLPVLREAFHDLPR